MRQRSRTQLHSNEKMLFWISRVDACGKSSAPVRPHLPQPVRRRPLAAFGDHLHCQGDNNARKINESYPPRGRAEPPKAAGGAYTWTVKLALKGIATEMMLL